MAMYPTQKRYIKKVMRSVMVSFNRNTEPELVEWIEQQENKQGYIKRLVREDMERQKKQLAKTMVRPAGFEPATHGLEVHVYPLIYQG